MSAATAKARQLPSPAEALEQINSERNRKMAMVIGGLVLFIVAMIGATVLMYSDSSGGVETVPAQTSF